MRDVERRIASRYPEHIDAARLYRLLVHQLTDFAIFLIDPDGIITTWNAGVRRNLGYEEHEFVGKDVSMIFTLEDIASGAPKRERQMAEQSGSSPDERWHVRKDGSRIYVDGVLSAVRDETGELAGFSKVMRDSTRRKMTEEALERSNRDLTQFAYVVSHDLQAPLRAVALYTELLMQRTPPSPETAPFSQFIQQGVEQMQILIRDVLRFAQFSDVKPASKPVNMEEVVEHALKNQQGWIEKERAVVTHDPLPTIPGEETHFLQIFQNLIGNALKYRSADPPRIHISATQEGGRWRFSVTDNGIGIPAEYQGQIFEPFKRLHGAENPGTGVGLAICKRIVEALGGKMWVESEPGRGSTFYFTL